MNQAKVNQLALEIRAELRSILNQRRHLTTPINQFEEVQLQEPGDRPRFFVIHGRHSRHTQFIGLRLGGITGDHAWPDERTTDAFYDFAKSVWHLKDRLSKWALATGQARSKGGANKIVHAVSDSSHALQICRALANWKKHSEHHGVVAEPRIGLIRYTMTESGQVEFFYDGCLKELSLRVEKPNPIPFRADIETPDGQSVMGDAATMIGKAFDDWLPLIRHLRVLDDVHPEALRLSSILFPLQIVVVPVTASNSASVGSR